MADVDLDDVAASLRPRLLGLAYRMLGSMNDAEDVVQDALLKARAGAPDDLRSPEAYLTTVTTRTAIDHLRSARVRRESYVGPWLPEPVLEDPASDAAGRAELADSLSLAFLVVLDTLSPAERAVLLLHDVFGYRHAEVAAMLDRSEPTCRQLLRRARQRLRTARPRGRVGADERERLVRCFMAACEGGSVEDFLAVLTSDATFVSDGGATVKAARRPITGAERIARFLAAVLPRGEHPREHRLVTVNGEPALAIVQAGRLASIVLVEGDEAGRIATIHFLRNPEKLARVRASVE